MLENLKVVATNEQYGEIVKLKSVYNETVFVAKSQLEMDCKHRLTMFKQNGDKKLDRQSNRMVIHRHNLILNGDEVKADSAIIEDMLNAEGGWHIMKHIPKTVATTHKYLALGYQNFRLQDGKLIHDANHGLVFAKKLNG